MVQTCVGTAVKLIWILFMNSSPSSKLGSWEAFEGVYFKSHLSNAKSPGYLLEMRDYTTQV